MKKIMFNNTYGLMRAVLEGRKTQTRRIVKLNEGEYVAKLTLPMGGKYLYIAKDGNPISCVCGYECPNYVRPLSQRFISHEEVAVAQSYRDIFGEEYLPTSIEDEIITLIEANSKGISNKMFVRADLMPHRIKITNIRIQRLQDISEEDCMKEGVEMYVNRNGNKVFSIHTGSCYTTAKIAFSSLIDKTCGKGTWGSNPWVFVYDFKLIK